MREIIEILMNRDGMALPMAIEAVKDARRRIKAGEDAEDILQYEFGLELDYVFDLIRSY